MGRQPQLVESRGRPCDVPSFGPRFAIGLLDVRAPCEQASLEATIVVST